MSDWLYQWFGKVIRPMISRLNGKRLARPSTFEGVQASMWFNPPDPAFAIVRNALEPTLFWQPRVFFCLPHFFCEVLCPGCHHPLEKNGANQPRRIIDMEDTFYIISWKYYCRKYCKKSYSSTTKALMDTLPAWLQHAFPAVLSRRSGLSKQVITTLRTASQHKMGVSGTRALLIELHTLRYNRRMLQYLEAILEMSRGNASGQTSIQSTMYSSLLEFGHFADRQRYGGTIPSEFYLTEMMNRAVEADESVSSQHTSLLAPDQIAVDDSMKVCTRYLIFTRTCLMSMTRSSSIWQQPMAWSFLGHYTL